MKLFYCLGLATLIAGCAPAPAPPPVEPAVARPLEVLQPGFDADTIRADLLATARERFGESAVKRALAAPTYLFAKRFFGMGPPPPPGAPADWRPTMPAALLIKDSGRWLVATRDAWREANAEAVAEIDAATANPKFWAEAPYTPACPDYGAGILLLKLPGRAETLRDSQCVSVSDGIVEAALRA